MRDFTPQERRRGIGWKSTWWLLMLVGIVAAFLGLFILLGGEDEYVGFGGDLAWRVGEISSAWTYSLLIGGIVLLAVVVAMTIAGRRMGPVSTTPVQDLMFHVGVFALVNAYVWVQDYAVGTGLDYAHLMTIPWGIGLVIHAVGAFTASPARGVDPGAVPEAEPRELQHH